MKKVAVVLSGCGFKDGSEITEAVSLLVALSQKQTAVTCFAPNHDFSVINHLGMHITSQSRNTLEESARISRGSIQDLNSLVAADFDGLALPGGFGAAKNLCSWAEEGAKGKVNSDLQKIILDFYHQSKPIAAICIAPAILALVLGKQNIEITIGNDPETAQEIKKTGAIHIDCPAEDHVSDREHKILTTPAYMYNTTPAHVFQGIQGMVQEFVEWC